ncbi:MAG TPA: DNA polymerase III subunit gamma and tau [Actinocrinis sp.]|nr:DNA polymerase III subunit gamma and tau [Actinocrinis sp.]
MSLALYRRYRPETFEEVIGQEHVTRPLQQALRNQRVNHAYLFSGPRGCGKTTSARILARCLNCAQGPTPTPCGTCKSCVDLARGGPGSIDVIEIDAASHGGVDDARDLRERAFFAPVSSTYKIYILDEAHMVSSAGFNALLKVVEEPPPHLKFIFATTEPEKVIGTIRSRTHHYPFRLVPPGVLRDYLAELCEKENVPVAPEVLPLVVRAGAGSVRDSLSVLDQLLAGAEDEGVTYPMAASLLGYTDASLLDEAVSAFAAGDGAAAFQAVDRVVEGGHDPRRFLADLLERLRDLLVLAAVPDAAGKGLVSVPGDQLVRMQEQANAFGAAELSRTADVVSVGLHEMRGATAPRLHLELVCARVLLPGAEDTHRGFAARLDRLERGAAHAAPPAGYVAAPAYAQGGETPQQPPAQYQQNPQAQPPHAEHQAQTQAQPPQGMPPMPGQGGPPAADPAGGAFVPPWKQQPAPAQSQNAPSGSADGSRPGGNQGQGGGRPSRMDTAAMHQAWPQILVAVRERSKVAWSMISEYAQVLAVDGQVLQLGISNPGLRDNFSGSTREEVLREMLQKVTGSDWKIEILVDPSASLGGAAKRAAGPGQPPQQPEPAQSWSAPAQAPAPAPSPATTYAPTAASAIGSAPAPVAGNSAAAPAAPVPPAPAGYPAGPAGQSAPASGPSPQSAQSLEEDLPDPDDVDLNEAGPTARDLLIRELGASVLEEHENVD